MLGPAFGLQNSYSPEPTDHVYLTISRRRRGDYKPIFTEVNIQFEITKPEATNCFSIISLIKYYRPKLAG